MLFLAFASLGGILASSSHLLGMLSQLIGCHHEPWVGPGQTLGDHVASLLQHRASYQLESVSSCTLRTPLCWQPLLQHTKSSALLLHWHPNPSHECVPVVDQLSADAVAQSQLHPAQDWQATAVISLMLHLLRGASC
jgi:hypothetical protein